MPPIEPIEIFFSYSRKDEEHLKQLLEHLANLERQGMIKPWTDRKIDAGQDWSDAIDEHLNTSKIVVLLISPSFMKSHYCYDIEVRRAMTLHANQQACVIPVILRPCDWKDTPFERLQALPRSAKPITKWDYPDDAFLEVATGIRHIVEAIRKDGKVVHLQSDEEQEALPELYPLLPHLCDRDLQISELERALERHRLELEQKGSHPRPVVCVIHGDAEEDPEWFEVRLRERSLPQYFSLDQRQKSVQHFQLLLRVDDAGREDILDALHKNLQRLFWGKGIISDPRCTKEQTLEALAALNMPVMIYSHVNAEGWDSTGRKLAEAFLDYSNSWPDLPPGLTLIHCLVVKYGRLENAGSFQRWKYQRNNSRARKFLGELKLSAYANIHGVLLPELSSISLAQVENWIYDGTNFDHLCLKHKSEFCSPPAAIARVTRFYNQSPSRKFKGDVPVIPMNPLAEELLEVLRDTRIRCQRGLL